MNLRASNKYLFNKTVKCRNCVYRFTDPIYNNNSRYKTFPRADYCSLNPYPDIRHYSHYYTTVVRKLTNNTFYFNCGPLGKFYEPK